MKIQKGAVFNDFFCFCFPSFYTGTGEIVDEIVCEELSNDSEKSEVK